jgi:hypothetical protein
MRLQTTSTWANAEGCLLRATLRRELTFIQRTSIIYIFRASQVP